MNRIRAIIREEIVKILKEFGTGVAPYYAPQGTEQIHKQRAVRNQYFDDFEKWQVVALQAGASVQDRGNDWIAQFPNKKVMGTFSKLNYSGFLLLIK